MFRKKKIKNVVNLPIQEFEEKNIAFFMSNSNPNKKKVIAAIDKSIEELGMKKIAELIYYHTMRFSHAKMDSPIKLTNDIYAGEPLEVYTSVDAPPFDYLDEHGEVAGVEIDIIKFAAQKLKMPIHINIVPFNSIFTNVEDKNNKFGVSGVGVSNDGIPERLDKFYFSIPFWALKLNLICCNDLIYNKIGDLSGLKIGVCDDEAGDIFVKQCIKEGTLTPNTKVFLYNNANEVFNAFLKKKIDCIVIVNYVADGLLDKLRSIV